VNHPNDSPADPNGSASVKPLTDAEKARLFGDLKTWVQDMPEPKNDDEAKLARAD